MEKKTLQHEGQAPTGQKSPSLRVKRFLQVFKQLQPHIIWVILVGMALYDHFNPPNVEGVIVFLLLIGVARGSISLLQALALLRSYLIPAKLLPPSEGREDHGQSGKKISNEQDKAE